MVVFVVNTITQATPEAEFEHAWFVLEARKSLRAYRDNKVLTMVWLMACLLVVLADEFLVDGVSVKVVDVDGVVDGISTI